MNIPAIKIFCDGADLTALREMAQDRRISGFTTNPTLMRKAGVSNYVEFAQQVLAAVPDRPVSFEVFADEFDAMAVQAKKMAAWGENVLVKVPITNRRRESSAALVAELSQRARVHLNVTALCTLEQVHTTAQALRGGASAVISVFAGRIADTGRDPIPFMRAARAILDASGADAELMWASPREPLNIVQAEQAGAHIITVPPEMLKKMTLFGKDLADFSLETVKMFQDDAAAAGYEL